MPKTVREKNIVAVAQGYQRTGGSYDGKFATYVHVDFSGSFPQGNISGIARVYDDPRESWRGERGIELNGNGRYSFMIGNRSIRRSDDETKEILTLAKQFADKYRADNPNALYEARLSWAKADAGRADKAVEDAIEMVRNRTKVRVAAEQLVQDILNERDPGR